MRRWMLVVAALTLMGAKKGKRGKKAPAEPPAPKVVVPADPGAKAWELPPVEGHEDGLDVTSMVRAKNWFKIGVDTRFMADIDATQSDAVLKTLAAHPEWRVFETPSGVRAAFRKDGSVGVGGYHQGARTWALFVGRTMPWSSDSVKVVPMAETTVDVQAFNLHGGPYGGRWTSAFVLDSPQLDLGVHEVADADGRSATVAAIESMARSMDIAVQTADDAAKMGVMGMYLPQGEPGRSASMAVSSPGKGLLEVKARVSPPDWGWTWVQLTRDGTPWAAEQVGPATREMVGTQDGAYFYLQGTAIVPSGEGFSGVAEVWFAAEGQPAVKLAETPVDVPAR